MKILIVLIILAVVAFLIIRARNKAKAKNKFESTVARGVERDSLRPSPSQLRPEWKLPASSGGYSTPRTQVPASKPVKRRDEDSTYVVADSGDTDFSGYTYEPPTYDEPSKPSYEAPSSTTDYTPSNYSSGGYTAPDTSYSSGGYSGGSSYSSDFGSSSSSSSSSDSGGGGGSSD